MLKNGVVHYCVSNMPGAVPHTSTYTLTNATMAYSLELANLGWRETAATNPVLAVGVNVVDGRVVHAAVVQVHGTHRIALADL